MVSMMVSTLTLWKVRNSTTMVYTYTWSTVRKDPITISLPMVCILRLWRNKLIHKAELPVLLLSLVSPLTSQLVMSRVALKGN